MPVEAPTLLERAPSTPAVYFRPTDKGRVFTVREDIQVRLRQRNPDGSIDQDAWREFLGVVEPIIRVCAATVDKTMTQREDVAQISAFKLVNFITDPDRYVDWTSIPGLIKTIVSRKYVDMTRAQSRDVRRQRYYGAGVALGNVIEDTTEEVNTEIVRRQLEGLINGYLKELPPDQKHVLEQAYYKGKTQRQISVELSIPIGTVKTRIHLAYNRLRKLFERDGLLIADFL